VSGGKAEPLFANGESGQALSWTRDRQYILMRRNNAKTGSDLVAVATTGEPREVVVAQSPYDETEGQFSPDGRWVAFVSNESGHPDRKRQRADCRVGELDEEAGEVTGCRSSPAGWR